MSTSAVYSPHPPASNPLPAATPESLTPANKPRFARGRSAGATTNGGSSVSPTRPAASTRSRRSHPTSKEPSPEKMSTSEALATNGEDDANEIHKSAKASTSMRPAEPDNHDDQELDTAAQDGANRSNAQTSTPASDDPSSTSAAKSQKIMLVIGRKRKADDEMTTVSSELHTPPSHTSKTPEVDPTSEPSAAVPAVPSDKHHDSTAASTTTTKEAPVSTDTAKASERSFTLAATTTTAPVPHAHDMPKRAPRKRRKWLRKGEVDPEDHKAVAEQRARHALIDAALKDLDEQEQALLDNTHPQLLALWDEVERRRDSQIKYNQYHEMSELRELYHLHLQELGQIRRQFQHDCEDLSTQMLFESRRALGRLEAEKTFHDRGLPSTKRMYTNMPTLGPGRGAGRWMAHTKRLLSQGTRRKTLVRVGNHIRQRVEIALSPRMATEKEANADLIRLGLREAPPESSDEDESEEEEDEEEQVDEPLPIIMDLEPEIIPVHSPPQMPKAVPSRARAPSPGPIKDIKPVIPRPSAVPPPASHQLPPERFNPQQQPFFMPPHPPPSRRMDPFGGPGPDGLHGPPHDPYGSVLARDRPPPLDPRPPPPPLDRAPPPMDPRDRAPPPLNDRPPPLGDHRDHGRPPPPHPYDRGAPPYDRGYPPPIDPHGRPPPLPSGSRVPPRYDDRGDWWGPRDRYAPPSTAYGMPPPPMPQTATAPPSSLPPHQPQTATPAGYWGGPADVEWNERHYYDRRFPPSGGPPPPPTYATQRGP